MDWFQLNWTINKINWIFYYELSTRGVLAIATRVVLAIATRVVLAIATRGVLEIATHEINSMQDYCVIQNHSWLKGWTQLNYIYCIPYCALHPY